MLLHLPKQTKEQSEYIVKFQVTSLTPGFYPSLYTQIYKSINGQLGGLSFPPAGYSQAFEECHNWDRRLSILTCQFTYTLDSESNSPAIAINLYDQQSLRTSSLSEIYITASYSNLMDIIPQIQYSGEFLHEQAFQLYRLSDSVVHQENAYLRIESSICLGDESLSFYKELPSFQREISNLQKGEIKIESSFVEFGRIVTLLKLPQKEIYILAKPQVRENQTFTESSYLLRVSLQSTLGQQSHNLMLSHDSRLQYELELQKQTFNVHLKWGPLSYTSNSSLLQNIEEYIVIISADKHADLDSQCAITHDATIRSYLHNYYTKETRFTYSQEKTTLSSFVYMNVFAKVPIQSKDDSDPYIFIPYNSIDVSVQFSAPILGTKMRIFLFAIAIICFIIFIIAMCKEHQKEKKAKSKPVVGGQNFEMISIRRESDSEESGRLRQVDLTIHE
ncbi:hypothetical protein FGO68_gene10498 [Halteria grandinella]|uniref:Uncharacterized protein n=1 Tax=Halteria grandinella TaxID=5974 RepID=A0A8J8SVX2_HALGN|nr:hypothetical protein FGO68_gene10498 [Halteria grandinella]